MAETMKGAATKSSVQITVARGRTVVHDGKRHAAGETVTVSEADAALLRERGFAADPETDAIPRVTGDTDQITVR